MPPERHQHRRRQPEPFAQRHRHHRAEQEHEQQGELVHGPLRAVRAWAALTIKTSSVPRNRAEPPIGTQRGARGGGRPPS